MMIIGRKSFYAAFSPDCLTWSYDSVCAICALPVNDRTKQTLINAFRMRIDSTGKIQLSEFVLSNLIQSNGRLMPFFRFSARYKVNREKWKIEGLGKRGEEQLIKAFKNN